MGKRIHQEGFQEFERVARDFYPTPASAVEPLLPFLPRSFSWAEPCVGDGALAVAIPDYLGLLVYACDIEPQGLAREFAVTLDCRTLTEADCLRYHIDLFITNPPWPAKFKRGEPTIGIIKHLAALRPSWFLLSADIAHNGYMAPLLDYCSHIVSLGRVKWVPGSNNSGVDNAAWYRFDFRSDVTVPCFYSRKKWDSPRTWEMVEHEDDFADMI